MNKDKALQTLGLEAAENINPDEVQSAYIGLIKSNKDKKGFDELLKNLNIARDRLNEDHATNLPAVLKSNSDLTQVIVQQANVAKIRVAKDELRQTFNTTKKVIISRPKRARDTAIFLTAASGVSTFFLTNMKDLLLENSISPSLNLALVLMTGLFGGMAFLLNSRATQLESNIDSFYEQLTRTRTTDKLVDEIFAESNTISEDDFETKMMEGIQKVVNLRSLSSGSIFLGGEILTIDNIVDFSDQYIDYLVSCGRIKLHKNADNERVITSLE